MICGSKLLLLAPNPLRSFSEPVVRIGLPAVRSKIRTAELMVSMKRVVPTAPSLSGGTLLVSGVSAARPAKLLPATREARGPGTARVASGSDKLGALARWASACSRSAASLAVLVAALMGSGP